MLSRRTTTHLGDYYAQWFMKTENYGGTWYCSLESAPLYDHLFSHDFPAYVCNGARALSGKPRVLKEWVMRFHTGESILQATPSWSWDDRARRGQEFLVEMIKACKADFALLEQYKRGGLDKPHQRTRMRETTSTVLPPSASRPPWRRTAPTAPHCGAPACSAAKRKRRLRKSTQLQCFARGAR